ncbi:HNH endonuclease family protein [Georgenia sp. AZ-5]|uniref:HNH endonuclease family protein n=1 Tax=Georgenia sp. AZ-5 TaxID=3367526 RepID=UPI0037544141
MHRLRLTVAAFLASLLTALLLAPAQAATTTAADLFGSLTVASEGGSTTYDRNYFNHWIDNNGDCQNTRHEVLIWESQVTPTYTSSSRCSVSSGRWYSYYDGASWTLASDVDIDHMVPLKEAWESGARNWSAYDRERFANDLGFDASLVAVTDNINQSKGDQDPASWLPPRSAARCTYAIEWVQVKYRWRLSINAAERDALSSLLSGSCGSTLVTVPARAR